MAELQEAIEEATVFCVERGVQVEKIMNAEGFQRIAFLDDAATHLVEKQVVDAVDDAVEKVILNDELKKKYLTWASPTALQRAQFPRPAGG